MKRKSAKEAGYMELKGAVKNGDCRIVYVPGGISQRLGCCNEFQVEMENTQIFSCGTCEYVIRPQASAKAHIMIAFAGPKG